MIRVVRATLTPSTDPDACCAKLVISGTANQDIFYQRIMGEYVRFPEVPIIEYPAEKGKPGKKYPVYYHFQKETEKRSFLYFYINQEPRKVETDCPQGCWVIGTGLEQ